MRASVWVVLMTAGATFGADAPVLTVVVRCEPHASLTPAFRQELQSQLKTKLSGTVGPTEVRLFDENTGEPIPLYWRQVFAKGLDRVEPNSAFAPTKTHFVNIRATGSQFEVQSRQYDGELGALSSATRSNSTADRANIVRLTFSHVVRDYGLIGQVKNTDGDRAAQVSLPSHVDGAAWVKPGDVFALVQLARTGQSVRVPNTLLRAISAPESGIVECRIESRFERPLAGWESGRFRAILLGAERNRAQVRVRSGPGGSEGLTVRFSSGAEAGVDAGELVGGVFFSRETYDRLAYVRVFASDRMVAHAPVEILGDAAVVVELKSDAGGGELIDVDARICRSRLLDLLARLGEENERIGPLVRDGRNARALDIIKSLLPRLNDELVQLASESSRLRPRLTSADADTLDRFLKQARDGQSQLAKLQKELERAIEAAKAPASAQKQESLRALVGKAEREVDEGEIDSAITIYEQVLTASDNWPDARKRLDELKSAWALKSDAHRQARETIYQSWAKCRTADDVEQRCPAARTALDVCIKAGDRFTAKKAMTAAVKASEILARRDEELRQSGGEDATRKLEQLRVTAGKVRTILIEAEKAAK